jgi:hypothetical protein
LRFWENQGCREGSHGAMIYIYVMVGCLAFHFCLFIRLYMIPGSITLCLFSWENPGCVEGIDVTAVSKIVWKGRIDLNLFSCKDFTFTL